MDLIQAAILGIVQGLTEYLPISSTAHIRILPALLGWQDPGAAFTAVIQVGTLLAVLLYFGKDIVSALRAWASSLVRRKAPTPEAKLGWAVFIGTLPIVVCGVAFKDAIEDPLRSLHVVAWSLIGLGLVLLVADRVGRRTRDLGKVTVLDGLWVGLWQCVALIPGCSRSGCTIGGSLLLGFDRATAARFSFLLSVPSVLAAAALELVGQRHELLQAGLGAVVVANLFSFVVGYASIAFLIRFLQTRSVLPFVVYRVALGLLLIGLLSAGSLRPDAGIPSRAVSPVHSTGS